MTPLRFPFVLFDAGDTLFGPRESFGAVYSRVLRDLGVALSPEVLEGGLRRCWREINRTVEPGVDRYRAYPGGEAEYWLRFVQGVMRYTPGAPSDPTLAARALEPLREAFQSPASWTVFHDVVPALAALRDAGARLGVVSNWDSRLPVLLDTLGLDCWFETVVVSHLEGVEKPRPEIFMRALERLGACAEETLHVGDVPELDAAGAEAAGIACVLVDRRGRLPGALPDLGVLPGLARRGWPGGGWRVSPSTEAT